MSHVPLFRPKDTPCGPERRGNSRFINQGFGYQYRNLISQENTNLMLDTLRPVIVFSGDDHDHCTIFHSRTNTTEVNLKLFNFNL